MTAFVASLDVHSVLFAYAVVYFAAACQLLLTWHAAGRPRYLAAWSAAHGCGAVATALFAARGFAPPALLILAANSFWLTGWGLIWLGARQLRRQRAPGVLALLPAALWLAASLLPGFFESVPLRLSIAVAFCTVCSLGAAQSMHGYRRAGKRSRAAAAFMLLNLTYCATMLASLVSGLLPTWNALGTIVIGAQFAAIGFCGLAIAYEHTGFAEAAALADGVVRAAQQRAAESEHTAEDIRATEAALKRLLNGQPLGVFQRAVAPDGTFKPLLAGGEVEMVTGWPATVLAAPGQIDSLLPPGAPPRAALMRRCLETGAASEEFRLRQPDGSWRWLRTEARRLTLNPDGSGEVVGYVHNIERERQAVAEAQRAARLASVGEVATGMAHELRQPLTIIDFAAQNAAAELDEGRPEEARRRLGRIVQQVERASRIIEHLRLFAQGMADPGATTPVALNEVVEAALSLSGEAMRQTGIAVVCDLPSPAPRVLAQAAPLEQVLLNLLANAREALAERPPGQPRRIRIAAETLSQPPRVRLTVADTGGGIAPDVLPLLFQPFVTTKLASKGTGMGLAASHGIVTRLGGDIAARNDAEGAVLTLTLAAAAG